MSMTLPEGISAIKALLTAETPDKFNNAVNTINAKTGTEALKKLLNGTAPVLEQEINLRYGMVRQPGPGYETPKARRR